MDGADRDPRARARLRDRRPALRRRARAPARPGRRPLRPTRGPVVLYVERARRCDRGEASATSRAIAGDGFQAIHVADSEGVSGIAQAWRGFSGDGPPLVALPRERHRLGHRRALGARARARARRGRRRSSCPSCSAIARCSPSLRGRTALALRLRLQGEQDVVLADVPVMVDATAPHRPQPDHGARRRVLLPISELNAASRHALGYALGLGSDSVVGLHVELGADDVSQTRAAWAARALPIPIKVVASPYRDLGAAAAGRDPRDHGRSGRRLRGRHARDHQPAPLAAHPAQPARRSSSSGCCCSRSASC